MSWTFEAQMQQILHPVLEMELNSPGALGPAGVGLLSLHFQRRRTHTEEAKSAQKWLSCQWKCGHLMFSRLQFLKNKDCEEKTHRKSKHFQWCGLKTKNNLGDWVAPF